MANNDLFSSDNIEDQTNLDDIDNVEDLDDNLEQYLEQTIGPDGKFYDPDEKKAVAKLAKGKVIADRHIKDLTTRLDKIREDYNKLYDESSTRARLEDVLKSLTEMQKKSTSNGGTNPDANETKDTSALDLNQLDELINKKMESLEENKTKANNLNMVKNKLREKYGNNYQNTLREQANKLGVGIDFMNNLAASNPNAFFRIAGIEENQSGRESFQSPPKGQINTTGLKAPMKERTESYYDELRKKDPTRFHSVANWKQMQDDAQRLGDAFYDL